MVKQKVSIPIQDAYTVLENKVNTAFNVMSDLVVDVRSLQQSVFDLNSKVKELQ